VTERVAGHHALSAGASKKASMTTRGMARMSMEMSTAGSVSVRAAI
jgi:hypothetical protein